MISKIIRRTHMYLALFLSPWVLMYALSTIAMNHRPLFRAMYDDQPIVWETEKEMSYTATFSENTERWMVGDQILSDLNLEGNHRTQGSLERRITITRNDPLAIRRITYDPKAQTLKIERQVLRAVPLLEHMHRRRGYATSYLSDDLWAITVDLFIFASVIWVASGIWMWWELKVTRRWGTVSVVGGIALFLFFLMTI